MTFPNPIVDVQRAAVSGNVYAALRRYADDTQSGTAFPPGLFYALWHGTPDVNRARVPDASYIRRERLDAHHDDLMPFHGAPDLAVLVVSQTDPTIFKLEAVRDFLAAGSTQVWMCFTAPLFEVHVYQADQPGIIRAYRGREAIDAGAVLPGFKLTVDQVFALPF